MRIAAAFKGLIIGGAMLLAAPALAAPTPVNAAAGSSWEHTGSGFVFAAELAGLKRDKLVDFGSNLVDIAATYLSPDGQTEATVYVYQAGLVDASVWHDRGSLVLQLGRLGTADMAALRTATFVPPNAAAASGIWSLVPLSGGRVKATAIALVPKDNWLIKVRLTSTTLDAAALENQLQTLLKELSIPAARYPAGPAYQMTPCGEPFKLKKARRVKADLSTALMAGLLGSMADAEAAGLEEPEAKPEPAPVYCREGPLGDGHSVYRPAGSSDRYVIAFGDAGVASFVGKDDLASLIGDKQTTYSLTLVQTDRRYSFTGFGALPPPDQAIEVLSKERPSSSSTRTTKAAGGTTVTLESNR